MKNILTVLIVLLLAPLSGPARAAVLDAQTLQAEAATLASAPVESAVAGFNGTGYVNFPASGGAATWANIDGGPGGGVHVTIRYALGGSAVFSASLTVNGVARRVTFAPTGSATTWGTTSAFIRVNAGATNTLVLATDGQDIGIVDEIALSQPAPVRVPVRVYWGGYQGMEQLIGTGASQWSWVQQHQDGLLLHGAYWGNPAESPAPATIAPTLATLLAPRNQRHIYETGFPGEYPRIDSALGATYADAAITDIDQLVAWGFQRPDISTDFHMYAWPEAMRYHPEWSAADFFAALCGNWDTYGGSAVSAPTYGWFRQWVEKLALRYPGIRITATNSPVYFNWDADLELGDGNNAFDAWLKLERRGAAVEALWSATGKTWRSLGTAATLSGPALAGLAATSKNNARLATAAFGSAQVYDFFFQDIGMPGRGGSLGYAGGTFTLTSHGDHTTRQGAMDNHFFAYREWTGDGAFVARVDSLAGSNPSRTWPLAGIGIRESLASNGRFVSAFVNAGAEARLQSRATAGANLSNHVTQSAQGAPKWLKLERAGNIFTASRSDDGSAWTVIGTTTLALDAAVKVGLVADSQVYWETVTAQFSNVSFLGTAAMGAAWTGQDIGGPLAGAQTIGSTISINAAGADIGGASDQFRFVHKPLAADGTILARCQTFHDKASPATALDALAKMGVMLRTSTAANAQNTAAFFTPQQGLRQLTRAADGTGAVEGGSALVGEAGIFIDLNDNRRTLTHYLTGNAYLTALRDAFPSTYKDNYAGFTTDSPYSGYMRWGGSETQSDAVMHRRKIRNYETFLQGHGAEHQLIANDNTSGATGTQAERDAWDLTYKNNSLRSARLHQLEGGRPDKVIFESWYSGPFTLVPETQNGTFANLAMDGIKYLKGVEQLLDLSVKRGAEPLFQGVSVRQSVPAGVQVREWRAASPTSAESFTIRLKNDGEVDALPVLQAYESGGGGWTIGYTLGGANITTAIKSADGRAVTDSTTIGQELIAPGATVDLTVNVTAASPVAARSVLVRAFWNPQDPHLAVKDAIQIDLLPPNIAPTAGSAFATTAPGASVDLDLWPLVADNELADASLWLGITGATNGTAALLSDGHTVRFTPTAGYNGPAMFTYSVRDAINDIRLLRSYTFEPPDDTADALATDAANLGPGALVQAGTGSYVYETGGPPAFGTTQTQALRLTEPGANDYARLGASVTTAEYHLSNSSWTASAWFKRATRNTHDFVFYIGNSNGFSGGGDELEVWLGANQDTINARYWDTTNVERALLTSANTAPLNTWNHVAVVWNATGAGAGTLTLYLNGVSVGSAAFTAAYKQGATLVFGGIAASASDPRNFNGWLDDCTLYAGALDTAEIARLATMPAASNAGLAANGTITINVDDLSNGLMARWPFDGNASDVTGNGYHLTLAGNATPSPAAKQQGTHSLTLDGTGDYAHTGALPMPLGGQFTIAAWVFVPAGATNIQTVAANGGGGNASAFRFYVNGYNSNPGDGKLVLETANGTVRADVASAAGLVAKDRWQHLAAVINRAAGTATLYRNGMQVAAGTIRTDFANNAPLLLGAMSGGGFAFRTNLDDVRVYSRLLAPAELATLINATNTPPTIGDLTSQSIAEGTNTGTLAVTIGDTETAPQHLALSASSSDPALVPNANIVIGGSGANRTVTVTPLANQLGTTTITVTVNDGTLTASAAFTVTVNPASPMNAWRFQYFATTANAGSAADTADGDHDNLTNLLEYALTTDPLLPSTTPTAGTEPGFLTLTYNRPTSAPEITYIIEWSDGLFTWSASGITEQTLSDNGTVRAVKAKVATTGTLKRFLRLRVTKP